LNVIDEYTRECLAIDIDRSIDAGGVVHCLDRLAAERGAPRYVRFESMARVHRLCGGRLVPVQRHRHRLHRPGITVAERVDRIVQRTASR
jgi:hypothetical protein